MDKKLGQIFEGWKNVAFPNPETEKLSKERMKICIDCEHFTPKGRCKKCGCFMIAKTRTKKASCPIKLW